VLDAPNVSRRGPCHLQARRRDHRRWRSRDRRV